MIKSEFITIFEYLQQFPEDLQLLVRPFEGKPLMKAYLYKLKISNYINDVERPRMFLKDQINNEYQTTLFLDTFSHIGDTIQVPITFAEYKGKKETKIICYSPIGYKLDNTISNLSKVNNRLVDEYITSKEYQNCMELSNNCYLLFKNGIQDFKYNHKNIYSEFENRIMKTKLNTINSIEDNNFQDGIVIRRYY